MSEFHWKDGWMFQRTSIGIRIYNEVCCVDFTIPYPEWLSILKATDSMKEAVMTAMQRDSAS